MSRPQILRIQLCAVVPCILAVACGPGVLTPESGRSMLQRQIDSSGRMFEIGYESVANLVQVPSLADYTAAQRSMTEPEAALQRLLKAGLVTQTRSERRLPDITGEYEGTMTNCFGMFLDLRMDRSARLAGTYRVQSFGCIGASSDSPIRAGALKGTLTPLNQVLLDLTPPALGSWDQAHLNLTVEGGLNRLIGTVTGRGYQWPLTVDGKGTGNTVVVAEYTYAFIPMFSKLVVPRGKALRAGPIVVDQLEDLLLEATDTLASARFRWHVDFNEAGQAVTGEKGQTGTGTVRFRKQPDGTWVVGDHDLGRAVPGSA